GRGVTLQALGSVLEKLGSEDAALDSYRQALELFQKVESPRSAASALVALGRLEIERGDSSDAADRLHEALSIFGGIGDPHGEIRALDSLARAERDLGRPREALEHLANAIEAVERVRRHAPGPHLRATYLASQQGRYDNYIEVAMALHRLQPEAGYSAAAFEASERARARALLDRLSAQRAARNAETDPHLLDREREIEQSLRLVDAERLRLLDRGGGPATLRALEARLDELLREHRAVRARLQADRPDAEGGQMDDRPEALDLKALRRQVLDPDTLLLQYRLGPRRSYVWAVDLEDISVHELPSRADLEEAARRAYELLEVSHLRETRAAAGLALGHLGRLLLEPLAGRLGERRLLVAGDGALLYIPFAALPTLGADAQPLLLRHEIVVLSSASTVALQRRERAGRKPAPGTIALLADPIFDRSDPRLASGAGSGSHSATATEAPFRRLPFAGQEAEAIAALADPSETFLALGVEASREAVSNPELGRYRILHLATHAELDVERPEMSRLVFSRFDAQGRPREPHLFAHELHGLRLPAELVVLSACSSALGKELRGEGLIGLTQGFFAAGAARVVVSLWPVEDRATAALMHELYRSLWVDGLPPAAALRQAQLTIRNQPGWRAPYYWAGFVLQGEWR
ncbi:MAG: CHAT domain-containing protein, partial [Holophagales bacterium]|nr:CHAT domain-containing protein [Holophagales bacterium]